MRITILALLLTTGFSTIVFAQQKKESSKIPLAVEKAFQKNHPNIKAKWEKEGDKYEAGYKQNRNKISELYSSAGALEEAEIAIALSQLPAQVSQYISKHQLGTIKEAAKITKADGSILYEAEVKSGDALFDPKGNFIRLQKD